MKIWKLTEDDLNAVAAEVGVTIYNPRKVGNAVQCNLKPDRTLGKKDGDHKYQRTSASGFRADRKVFAVCWHGYRDFMQACFEREPDARIKTMFADYRGLENFLEKFESTGYTNVGSRAYPMQAREVCNCWKGEWNVHCN